MAKERPIIFSTTMVKAILEGRKIQTRRIINPQPIASVMNKSATKALQLCNKYIIGEIQNDSALQMTWKGCAYMPFPEALKKYCPYGKAGDVLWVREKFRKYIPITENGEWEFDNEKTDYYADGSHEEIPSMDGDGSQEWNKDGTEKMISWKPSIHMPRKTARLFLEITNIRVEQLNSIEYSDCYKEGIGQFTKDDKIHKYGLDGWEWSTMPKTPKIAFQKLWELINGEGSWKENPFVWVVEFKKCVGKN